MATKLVVQRGPRSWKFTLDEARFVSKELKPLLDGTLQRAMTSPVRRKRRRRKATKKTS